jgi:threonine/homoserine/homoserine lactone efflux protein
VLAATRKNWRTLGRFMPVALFAGVMMGLLVAMPFGPVSLVCVRHSLEQGPRFGTAAGLGAASAQGVFATVAVTGSDTLAACLVQWDGTVRLISALVLVGLGLRLLFARSRLGRLQSRPVGRSMTATYASTLSLAVSNPMTVLPYLAVASGVGATAPGTGLSAWSIPGVMLGAGAWYAMLTLGTWLLRRHLKPAVLTPLNRIAGAALIGFGAFLGIR